MSSTVDIRGTQVPQATTGITADLLHDVVNVLLVIGAESELAARALPAHRTARVHLDSIVYLAQRASAISKGVLLLQSGASGLRLSEMALGRLIEAISASIRDQLRVPVRIAEHVGGVDEAIVSVDEARFRTSICVLAFCVLDGVPPGDPRSLWVRPAAPPAMENRLWVELDFGANARSAAEEDPSSTGARGGEEERAARGLGLSLVEEMMSLHGGAVAGRATASGTHFVVRLPRVG